jgi:hypothetical protein
LITPMPDQLNTTPQLTDRHGGQKDRPADPCGPR